MAELSGSEAFHFTSALTRLGGRSFSATCRVECNVSGKRVSLSVIMVVFAHGGTIDVMSEQGAGATFTIRLPRHHGTPATA